MFKADDRFLVLSGRDKFASTRMAEAGRPLGDVDVLVAEPSKRRLLAIEAKDVAGTLTPSELASALKKTFGTATEGRSAMQQHELRLEWLRAHLREVLSEFGLDTTAAASWAVEGLFMTSRAVPAAYTPDPALPILALRDMRRQLTTAVEKPKHKRSRRKR